MYACLSCIICLLFMPFLCHHMFIIMCAYYHRGTFQIFKESLKIKSFFCGGIAVKLHNCIEASNSGFKIHPCRVILAS